MPSNADGSHELEREVVALFDELHHRLLRYVLSFGLAVADGEEIIQEAFLALVKHIQQGRSRRNLARLALPGRTQSVAETFGGQ